MLFRSASAKSEKLRNNLMNLYCERTALSRNVRGNCKFHIKHSVCFYIGDRKICTAAFDNCFKRKIGRPRCSFLFIILNRKLQPLFFSSHFNFIITATTLSWFGLNANVKFRYYSKAEIETRFFLMSFETATKV